MHAVGVCEGSTSGFGCIKLDHCWTIGSEFGGRWSLTFTNENTEVMSIVIVPSTSLEHVYPRLEEIKGRPNVAGRRYVLYLDNVPHSLEAPTVRLLLEASGAEALLQDDFHVHTSIKSVLNNTHADFVNGRVSSVRLIIPLRPYWHSSPDSGLDDDPIGCKVLRAHV